MGQWGAQGYAQQGYTDDQILAAYYPGTTLGQTTATSIRVLLASGKKKLTISSEEADHGRGRRRRRPHAARRQHDAHAGAEARGRRRAGAGARSAAHVLARRAGSTLTLGRAYRGRIVVDVPNKKLRAINVLGLAAVPLRRGDGGDAVQPGFPQRSQAQAVAARSYALASRQAGAPFDVYADGRSQAYLGVSAETPAGKQAVDATAGEVLLYNGDVA